MLERQTQKRIEAEMSKCRHFNGVFVNKTCLAGVSYDELLGTGVGCYKHLVCLNDQDAPVVCMKREFPTRAEAEQTVADDDRQLNIVLNAVPAIKKDAKAKGFGVGRGGKSGMPCPVGCGGAVNYSVADCNGHMHASCTTDGCISFME